MVGWPTMTTVRVQTQNEVAGAPSVGSWAVYRNLYFTVSGSPTPSPTVATQLRRLVCGHDTTGTGTYSVCSDSRFRSGAGSFRIKTWTLSGGLFSPASDQTFSMEGLGPSATPYIDLPSQLAIAVGYRADLGSGVPRQRGRSRWWLGPLTMSASALTGGPTSGGMRLADATVDRIVSNAVGCLTTLASAGWVLGVRSMGADELVGVDEVYVDSILDVQRKRRPWMVYQKRQAW